MNIGLKLLLSGLSLLVFCRLLIQLHDGRPDNGFAMMMGIGNIVGLLMSLVGSVAWIWSS